MMGSGERESVAKRSGSDMAVDTLDALEDKPGVEDRVSVDFPGWDSGMGVRAREAEVSMRRMGEGFRIWMEK